MKRLFLTFAFSSLISVAAVAAPSATEIQQHDCGSLDAYATGACTLTTNAQRPRPLSDAIIHDRLGLLETSIMGALEHHRVYDPVRWNQLKELVSESRDILEESGTPRQKFEKAGFKFCNTLFKMAEEACYGQL